MTNKEKTFKEEWKSLVREGKEEVLREKFISLAPEGVPGKELYKEAEEAFSGEELAEICAELILTIFADCSRDDFHNWDYDHISFIIEASSTFGFSISRNIINGLPEQLILRIKKENLKTPEC